MAKHAVQFYEADTFLEREASRFAAAGLAAGEAVIVVATAPHQQAMATLLQVGGWDLEQARADGRYVTLDAADTLSRFMLDGQPDTERFAAVIEPVLERALADHGKARVFGEMVALLAVAGNHAAALQLEQLWNALQQQHPFALLCAYPLARLGDQSFASALAGICATHDGVAPAESYRDDASPDDRLQTITALQQKAQWLEAAIAERRRVEEQLQRALAAEHEARAAADAALRLRDQFFAVAAHELKTPITVLMGQAQLVQRRLPPASQTETPWLAPALDVLARQSDKLAYLVNQLVLVARLDSGSLTLAARPTDLTALVEQARQALAPAGQQRHAISIEAPGPLWAVVDPIRLEQVVTNLLDNAIRYSPDGGAITIGVAPVDDGMIELTVRDQGLGVPVALRERLFERFFQGHTSDHQSGLGLGLYLSRQIVRAHGGTITLDFPAEGGVCVTVRLPQGRVESPPLALNGHTPSH